MSAQLNDFSNYLDEYNLIVQKNKDPGDSAQRTGIYLTLMKLSGFEYDWRDIPLDMRYTMAIMMYRVDTNGTYARTPSRDSWASCPHNFSRDQRAMLELAMAVMGDKKELKRSMKKILLRGGFHQNVRHGTDDPDNKWKVPDFITPGQITTYIRGIFTSKLAQIVSQPTLMVLDLGLLFDVAMRADSHDIDNMLATKLLFDYKVNSTFVSRFAMRKYLTTDFMEKIARYHSEEIDLYGNKKNGIRPFITLFKEAYRRNNLL
jgi:hypothetical protein